MINAKKDLVYVPMVADHIHHGHINIIKVAKEYGHVIVGLMTDKAAASYKRLPLLNFKQRLEIIKNINGVDEVIPQDEFDYVPYIKKYKPKYFVHGSDWKTGIQKKARERVIKEMQVLNGYVIEPEYTKDISSTLINNALFEKGVTPEFRLKRFRRLIENKELVRGIDVHNGLTGLIAEDISVIENEVKKEFDFFWLSSLTDSTAKGKPDIELVDVTSRLNTIHDILDITTKPIVFDADTGGIQEHFTYLVKTLERLGVSACVIEDKKGLKRNSLFGNEVKQEQESIDVFSEKISAGKSSLSGKDFMIIARIESLILDQGMDDAIKRAEAYIKAGADAIMIHSMKKEPDEIMDFCRIYNKFNKCPPLVAVPSSYNKVFESELKEMGVDIVIYANHLLRSAYPAMRKTALSILKNGRSLECDKSIMSIKEILNLIPGIE